MPVVKTDGDGLTFTLSAKGTAAWTLRYRYGGKAKELTLGRYPDLTLTKARELAAPDCRPGDFPNGSQGAAIGQGAF